MRKTIENIVLILIVLVISVSCAGNEDVSGVKMGIPRGEGEISGIYLKSKKFFWMLQPWKEGTLATIDGWGQISELSFEKNGRIQIKALVNFPKMELDKFLMAWPSNNLLYCRSAQMVHLADTENKKTISFIPIRTWRYWQQRPSLLDPEEGLLVFSYRRIEEAITHRAVIYNYRTGKTIYEDEQDTQVYMERPLDKEWILSRSLIKKNEETLNEIYFYNWKTKERQHNKLTEILTSLNVREIDFGYGYGIHLGERYILGPSWSMGKTVKVSWNEEYTDVTVLPLEYLLPDDKYFSTFFISPNGKWVTTYIGSYEGLYGERLYKRAFFHMDDRYPGGISIPVFAEGYEGGGWDTGAFVIHPEYGMCYASEYNQDDQLYLRLFKMDDVLMEIGRKINL